MSHETETETVTELDNLTANTSVFFEIVLFKKKSISMNMQGTFMEIFLLISVLDLNYFSPLIFNFTNSPIG